jgi:biotin operon repressor
MKTQKQILLEELQKGKALSKMYIINELGILNAWDVVHKLRNKGYPINSEMIKNKTTGARFAVYSLIKTQ